MESESDAKNTTMFHGNSDLFRKVRSMLEMFRRRCPAVIVRVSDPNLCFDELALLG